MSAAWPTDWIKRGCCLALLMAPCALATAQYVDTNSGCIQCHETGLRQNDFCPTIPAAVWAEDDKHAKSFYLLHESDPQRPEQGAAKRALVKQILGFALEEAFTDGRYLRLKDEDDAETQRKTATVKSCLRCHATWPKEADTEHAHEPPVSLELGVSCQACHGPGERWDVPHRLVAWRAVTPNAKSALGFSDCRSPVAKARLCASCHVGSIAEDKFVKHEWYAAGHPPLPSFELASFEMQMPVHWKPLREKREFAYRDGPPSDNTGQFTRQIETLKRNGIPAEAIKSSYLEANFAPALAKGLDPGSDLAAFKDAVVGGGVVFETYVRQIADYTAQVGENDAPWPELALYDCAACHHELRRRLPVSSQVRLHPPGRPPLADWPQALAKLTAQHAGGYDEAESARHWAVIDEKLIALERATTGRPFGDRDAMRQAAVPLAEALTALVVAAEQTRYDEATGAAAIAALARSDSQAVPDFPSARQMAWAITAIAGDLQFPASPQFFEIAAADPLCLRLPSGPQASIIEDQRRWLGAAARFDAEWFQGQLTSIRARLTAP